MNNFNREGLLRSMLHHRIHFLDGAYNHLSFVPFVTMEMNSLYSVYM